MKSNLMSAALLLVFAASAVADDEKMALAKQAQAILKANCYRCHGQEGSSEGGFTFVLDAQRLRTGRKLVPGDGAQSQIYKKMKKDEMPPEDEKPRPSAEDIAVIRKWIDAGAPDWNTIVQSRRWLSFAEMNEAIQADLNSAGERDRKYLRYFTLTHLYNAGWTDEELESYRLALSKLINSLSWGKRVIKPAPVDLARTIFRIDLRDYKWSERVWSRILGVYPYGVIDNRSPAFKYCAEATACPLPYVRGDWFVAAASRPPLYHEVLQLPASDRELEKQLHVDVEEDIRQERVARAGFNGSGVSRNNRLIERHESGYGAYWKSYDFVGSAGRQALFEYPLGPSGPNAFKHSGGEIIFSLPNGLQGYLLVDDVGNRIDKGPTSIVSDPKQPDRAVVNGLSCMSCHARGMIDKADQVRESVMKNPKAFPKKEAETILALYLEKRDMDKLIQDDARRFARAVAETGCKVDFEGKIVGSDPVVNLALLFERDLDLRLAAAEVNVKPETLTAALERSPGLARAMGVLRVEGGTLQRQSFIAIFRDLVRALDLGTSLVGGELPPRNSGATGNPAPIDGVARRLFDEQNFVYLADLPEFDVKNGEWPFTKDGTTGSKDMRIKVGGKPSTKGLGMHPPPNPAWASVKYRLAGQAALLKTTVAVNDTANFCWTPAIFTVLGDGKQLFQSGNIAHNHSRTQECSVNISGVDVLELRVHSIGNNSGVHAVWVDPRLLQTADTADPGWPRSKKLFANGPREFLSDLLETDSKVGPWPLGTNGDKGDGKQIQCNGKASPKGLGMHPPSRGYAAATYRLNKQAEVFRAAVALDDSARFSPSANVTFEVHGDGKRLWTSSATPKKGEAQKLNVNVAGVDLLELRVVCPGFNHGLAAVWLEPRLLQTPDAADTAEPRAKRLFADGPQEYLSSLAEFNVKAGPWPFTNNGETGEGKQIRVNGQTSPKGLGMHPPDKGFASASYRLDKNAARFKGSVAIDDSSPRAWSNAVFEVHGDGKLLWASRPIGKRRDVQDFSVKVSGIDVLELRVVAQGSHMGLHAVWIEPRLQMQPDTDDK